MLCFLSKSLFSCFKKKNESFVCVCDCVHRYHVPRSWLKPRGNLIVLFEELGGDVSKVSVVKRSVH